MKEIINICLSQSAGHLQCHFNNQQESYLDYTGGKNDLVNPSIFLHPARDPIHKTVSYTPRSILIDAKNGFGSLGRFEYLNSGANLSGTDALQHQVEKIQLSERIEKTEYQKALDTQTVPPKLNQESTNYWSDYTRLIYDPRSFYEMPNWLYNGGKTALRSAPQNQLKDFEIGFQEFQEQLKGAERPMENFLDDSFRIFIEKCDNLSGINCVTEIDSAWGGVNNGLLMEIKDEFVPKIDITTWGLYGTYSRKATDNRDYISTVKSTIFNATNSSLFVPLNNQAALGNEKFVPESLWHRAAVTSCVFETVNLLFANKQEPVTMTDYINGLTMGTKRNVVTEVKMFIDGREVDVTAKFISNVARPAEHYFSKSCISRYTSRKDFNKFEQMASSGTPERGLIDYSLQIPFTRPDSFPDIFDDNETDQLNVSMAMTDKVRPLFKEMKEGVSRFMKGDDREYYLDELDTYLGEYEFGWSDDEEFDDD